MSRDRLDDLVVDGQLAMPKWLTPAVCCTSGDAQPTGYAGRRHARRPGDRERPVVVQLECATSRDANDPSARALPTSEVKLNSSCALR